MEGRRRNVTTASPWTWRQASERSDRRLARPLALALRVEGGGMAGWQGSRKAKREKREREDAVIVPDD
jgi:hypothetical protein